MCRRVKWDGIPALWGGFEIFSAFENLYPSSQINVDWILTGVVKVSRTWHLSNLILYFSIVTTNKFKKKKMYDSDCKTSELPLVKGRHRRIKPSYNLVGIPKGIWFGIKMVSFPKIYLLTPKLHVKFGIYPMIKLIIEPYFNIFAWNSEPWNDT